VPLNLFSQSHSESDLRATIAALKISKLLFRNNRDLVSSLQAVAELLATSFAGSLAIEIVSLNQAPQQWIEGEFDVDHSKLFFAEHKSAPLRVRVWLSAPGLEGEFPLQLLVEYLAQQAATFAEARNLAENNRALQEQIKVEQESLALRKIMERAKALITKRGPLSPQEAEEFLITSSVRSGRPLMKVASEIVLAYGGPEPRFKWEAPQGRRDSQNLNRAVA
jgi:hypothetical protein